MKQPVTFIGVTALCLIINVWAAERLANFAGTWILDTKNSDPFLRPIRDLGAQVPGGGMGGGGMGGGGMPGGMGRGTPGGSMPGKGIPGKGTPGRGTAESQPPPLIIEQTESELRITRTIFEGGKLAPVLVVYRFDESERVDAMPIPNSTEQAKVVTKIKWGKNKFQIRTTSYLPQGKNEIRREYSLSKDGKVLTVQTSDSTPMGELIQKQIYNRQEK